MLYIYLTITGEIILNQQQIPTLRQTQQKKDCSNNRGQWFMK